MDCPVLAHHLILSAYGFWLPNDPRGSWTDIVRAFELRRFGPATKTRSRRSLARDSHDWRARLAAKKYLARDPVIFTGLQARAIARGFASQVAHSGLNFLACAIMPDHVHAVITKHTFTIEQIVNLLKGCATRQLLAEGIHPFADLRYRDGSLPRLWARGYWKIFLRDPERIATAIVYIENNPVKEGKKKQTWNIVTRFTNEEAALRARG